MKKTVYLVVALIMILTSFSFAAGAAGSNLDTATEISLGYSFAGNITQSQTNNYYKLVIPVSGKVKLQFSGNISLVNLKLINKDGETLWNEKQLSPNSNQSSINYATELSLTSGVYYFNVSKPQNYTSYGDYSFTFRLYDAQESFKEVDGGNNNYIEAANDISLDKQYNGQIALNDLDDYYKFAIPTSGIIDLQIIGDIKLVNFHIYSSTGAEVWEEKHISPGSNKININFTDRIVLNSGTYYIHAEKVQNYSNYGNYSFRLNFTEGQESFKETYNGIDNYIENANTISLNKQYNGQIALGDSDDYYKFVVPDSGKVSLKVQGNISLLNIELCDASGYDFWEEKNISSGSNKQYLDFSDAVSLDAGTYYLHIKETPNYHCYGTYSFAIGTGNLPQLKLSQQPLVPGELTKPTNKEITQSLPSNSQPTTTRPADKPTTTRPADKPTTTRPSDKPTTTRPAETTTKQPASKPATTRPSEVNTTQKKEEKTTRTPVKKPEHTKAETYVNSHTNPQVEIYIYIDFEYTIINNYVIIINYIGNDSDVVIPEKIDGYEVKGIGDNAFAGTKVESVSIPDSVNQFGSNVFGEENGQGTYLYCSQGSAAHSYADRNGVGCVLNMVEYPEDSSSSVSDGLSAKTIAVIAAVAVLVIGAVIVVIVIGMKKTLI